MLRTQWIGPSRIALETKFDLHHSDQKSTIEVSIRIGVKVKSQPLLTKIPAASKIRLASSKTFPS